MASSHALSRTSEVSQLTPQGSRGAGKVYELTASSASPTRVIGTDDAGFPIEETLPHAYWREFVGLDGCVKKVPLRTSVPFTMEPEGVRYEQQVTTDIVQAGQLPLDVCPFTGEFGYIQRPRLIANPEGTADCGGKPDGCEHMLKLIVERKKRARTKYDLEQKTFTAKSQAEMIAMKEGIIEGVADVMAKHLPPPNIGAAKARMRDGKCDPGVE